VYRLVIRHVRLLRQVLLVLMLCTVMQPAAHAVDRMKYRLQLQVSEDSVERLMLALNIAKHVQNEFGPTNVEVQIVVFGPAVQTLKYYAPIPVAVRVREAKYNGVRIEACLYSMRAAHLKPAQMLPEINYVPSGVVDMMERQSQGWITIRP
jgi:intracellular sulfur oxidation DsrE/DsrF family protein